MEKKTQLYDKHHPFIASIDDRFTLCGSCSTKDTQHVILNIKNSGIQYSVGDSVAVFPVNDPALVERTMRALKADGTELILDKHSGMTLSLQEFISQKANISDIPRKFLIALAEAETNSEKKNHLEFLLHEENKQVLREYLLHRELWDLLEEYPTALLSLTQLGELLQPLLPRFYSIASSPVVFPDQIHLTVAYLQYETNQIVRKGVCTHYLCHLAPKGQNVVPIYIQPNHGFTLPVNSEVPIIMIGPGTGIAPFRAFMQERMAKGGTGKNWLFFGERTKSGEFFYKDEWDVWMKQGALRLDTAFSRDQEYKIYVQDMMWQHGAELFTWLEGGAILYVCGDANHMAKDVDATLHRIVETHGNMDNVAARQYVKKMRQQKRYLRDVY